MDEYHAEVLIGYFHLAPPRTRSGTGSGFRIRDLSADLR
jgi:hypothetical protein